MKLSVQYALRAGCRVRTVSPLKDHVYSLVRVTTHDETYGYPWRADLKLIDREQFYDVRFTLTARQHVAPEITAPYHERSAAYLGLLRFTLMPALLREVTPGICAAFGFPLPRTSSVYSPGGLWEDDTPPPTSHVSRAQITGISRQNSLEYALDTLLNAVWLARPIRVHAFTTGWAGKVAAQTDSSLSTSVTR